MKMKVSREETNLVVVRCVQSYIFFLFNDKISIKKTLIRPDCCPVFSAPNLITS